MAAGEKGATVGSLDIVLKCRSDEFEKDAKKAGKNADKALKGSLGKTDLDLFEVANNPIASFTNTLSAMFPVATKLAGGLTTMAAAAGALTLATAYQTQAQERFGQSLGITTESVQRFEGAFQRVGVGGKVAGEALGTVTSLLADAKLGVEDAQSRFEALGLSVEKVKAMGGDQALRAILTEVSKLGSVAEQEAQLSLIFGDSARDLVNVTRLGVDGVNAMFKRVSVGGKKANEELTSLASNVSSAWGASLNTVGGYWRDLSRVASPHLKRLTAMWHDANKALFNQDSRILAQQAQAQAEDQQRTAEKAAKSAAEYAKRKTANLAVDAELRKGEREMLSFRNDRLKIEQEIEANFKSAPIEKKAELTNAKIDRARLEFSGQLEDNQINIVGILDKEAGIRARIARDMKLATEEQRKEAFLLEKQKDGAQTLFDFRASTVGGANALGSKTIDNARLAGANPGELASMTADLKIRSKEALGDTISPQMRYDAKVAKLNADTSLTPDQRKRGLDNAMLAARKQQTEFLASFGKVVGPFSELKRSTSDILAAVKQGVLDPKDAKRALSDNYSKVDSGPKMAQSLEYGSTEFYKRISSRIGGYDKKDPNTRVADNTERLVKLFGNVDKNLARQLQDEIININ